LNQVIAQASYGFAADQTVQTKSEDGQWMFLQNAATATGLSEKTLRRYIKKRLIRSRRLGKQTNSPLQAWITADVIKAVSSEPIETDDVIDAVAVQNEDADDFVEESSNQSTIEPEATSNTPLTGLEQIVKSIAQQFSDKLDQQKDVIYALRDELHDKEIQLKLLPDLQKQLQEKELAVFEAAALQKQIEELNKQNEQLRNEAEDAKQQLSSLQQKRPWWKKLFSEADKHSQPS
jgi:hypothetical protein